MKAEVAKALFNSKTYPEFRKLITDLVPKEHQPARSNPKVDFIVRL